MSKDKTFSELMRNPEQKAIDDMVMFLQEISKDFEDKHGHSRLAVCQAFLETSIALAIRRYDERYFKTPNEIRYFLYLALNTIQRQIDAYPNHIVTDNLNKRFGKDFIQLRDAKLSGWVDPNDSTEDEAVH